MFSDSIQIEFRARLYQRALSRPQRLAGQVRGNHTRGACRVDLNTRTFHIENPAQAVGQKSHTLARGGVNGCFVGVLGPDPRVIVRHRPDEDPRGCPSHFIQRNPSCSMSKPLHQCHQRTRLHNYRSPVLGKKSPGEGAAEGPSLQPPWS